MPKLNVYVSDRLAEAVKRYEVPLSETCQRALEQEVARALPLMELTPAARELLRTARERALSMGHSYVGAEHLLLALLEDERSLAARVLEEAGNRKKLRASLLDAMANPAPASNRVGGSDGNVYGYLVADEDGGSARVIRPDGTRVTATKDEDGVVRFTDETGQPLDPIPLSKAPHIIDLDESGRPVVVVDERGRHIER